MKNALKYTTLLLLSGLACSGGPAAPGFSDDADARILFIGNSLTYTHDVPRLVRMLGERQGLDVETASIASANFSLEDHWNNGAAREIRRLAPDFVVMQQGPSSLVENQAHLAEWAQTFATVIREVGGVPALYMVWPDVSRRFAFPAVEQAYSSAAEASGSLLLPAGTTWLEAWEEDENLALYGPDGFHPSYLGALAAAQTIHAALFEVDPLTLPALDDEIPAARMDLLRRAVAASLEKWRE